MRKQFVQTVTEVLDKDEKASLILGDIGVHGFSTLTSKYPDRAFNIGILEQATIGVAAGLSIKGFDPIVHTIAPFIIERGLEQLKIDFGYQNLSGNFVSVGAAYDYASLGPTHHCPADIEIVRTIPNFNIFCPGTAKEFDQLFKKYYKAKNPNLPVETFKKFSPGFKSDANPELKSNCGISLAEKL